MTDASVPESHRMCTACAQNLPLCVEYFYRNSKCRFGLTTRCRRCLAAQVRQHRKTARHKDVARAYRSREEVKERARAADAARKLKRQRTETDRARERAATKRYRQTAKGKAKTESYRAAYNARPENKARVAEIERKKRAANSDYRLSQRISAMLRGSLAAAGEYKARRPWEKLLGYTRGDLKRHIERQFHDGMSWDNAGQWEIDHIVPLALFKYESANDLEFRAAWALTNLRPLWMRANRTKGARRTLLL